MTVRNYLYCVLCLLLVSGTANAGLVAYYPVNQATDSSTFLDDVIDDASHDAADGNGNNNSASVIFDATRGGDVVSTVNGHRYTAGFQDSDLSTGFTWSLFVKSDSNANLSVNSGGTDPNDADVIIGSRNGIWNKVQPTGTARWFDLNGYNIDDDTWHHIAYTGDSTNGAFFYIDGVQVASDSTPFGGNQTENTKLEIGGASQFTEDWAGLMDEISIWDEALDVVDIAALAAGTSPFALNTVVPEPSTYMLFSVAILIGLAVLRRRK